REAAAGAATAAPSSAAHVSVAATARAGSFLLGLPIVCSYQATSEWRPDGPAAGDWTSILRRVGKSGVLAGEAAGEAPPAIPGADPSNLWGNARGGSDGQDARGSRHGASSHLGAGRRAGRERRARVPRPPRRRRGGRVARHGPGRRAGRDRLRRRPER